MKIPTTTGPGYGVRDEVRDHGSTTYGYGPDANGKTERRGLPTTLTHTTAGQVLTFTGAYDPAGNLTTQKLPGGLTQTTTYDTLVLERRTGGRCLSPISSPSR